MVDGEPKPTIEWSKGKWMKIKPNDQYQVYQDEATSEYVFKIKDVKSKDAGTYTVTASNEHGSEQCPASMMITTKAEEVNDYKSQLKKRYESIYIELILLSDKSIIVKIFFLLILFKSMLLSYLEC